MALYKVYGEAIVGVTIEVEADTPEEAFDNAYDQLEDLEPYTGIGCMDLLIGTDLENAHLEPQGITYFEAVHADARFMRFVRF